MRIFPLLMLSLLVAGCATDPIRTSISGSECKIFERPAYALQGRTRYDQNVMDDFVETGVGGCGWQRPAARPPEIQNAAPLKPRAVAAPVKRKSAIRRFRDRVLKPRPVVTQTAPEELPARPVIVDAPAPPAAAQAAREADPLDELSEPLVSKPVIRRGR